MSSTLDRPSTLQRGAYPKNGNGELPLKLPLELIIDDRDVIRALVEYPEGEERSQFATEALKIGVLALRHVGGHVSADHLRREGDRFLGGLQTTLDLHKQLVQGEIENKLKEYFNPEDGRFTERVQRLVAQDGELSQLIKGFIDGENSQLARTMCGQLEPLMKHLDPKQSEGLLAVLRNLVEERLKQQSEQVLKEFSLDHKDGALCRMIDELTAKHGDFSKDLQKKIDEVVKEFSLNEEGSALKRLVDSVDRAQRRICDEFSLDNDQSALKRFKTELMTVFQAHVDTSARFQEEVKLALQKLTTRREVEAGTPRHGIAFEEALLQVLCQQANQLGDIAQHTGSKTGLMKGRVVGDIVIELGPETAAPCSRIVFEAKEREHYSMEKARAEIEMARKNRQAQIGVFVFSKKTAPDHLRPIARYGSDIFVIWDSEDPTTDIYVTSALDIARGLCVRQSQQRDDAAADFTAIDKAILDIEQRAKNLGEIGDCAQRIHDNAEQIQERVRIDRKELERQVAILRERIGALRETVSSPQ